MYDSNGRLATIYREFRDNLDSSRSYLLYMRADLLDEYLKHTSQTLIWLLWGERDLQYGTFKNKDNIKDLLVQYAHIHKAWFIHKEQS